MSAEVLLYLHVTLTGLAIAAAGYHFAPIIGAPKPRILPVTSEQTGVLTALLLWILSGPVALGAFAVSLAIHWRTLQLPLLALTTISILWAFSLGVLALELVFRLTH